jgi:DNA-directed RNA polymerase subunit RPC12/RpoP
MIEVSCIYCGKPVRIEQSPACKHVECPACGHTFAVSRHKPDVTPRSAPGACTDASDEGEKWAGKSNEEITERLLSRPVSKEERDRRAAKVLLLPLLPRYDDLTLFALSLAFLLLVLISAELRQDLARAFSAELGTHYVLLLLLAVLGMVCSFVNVFLQRKRYEFEKQAMLAFAVLVTAGTGIYAGYLMLDRSQGWLMVFPAWNILDGGLLLLLARAGIVDTECITDEKATFKQVLITAIAVPILLTTCLFLFDLYWATTFSIATAYTMNLHKTLRYLFSP